MDFTKGTLRPKNKAIEKMFYLLFSIDARMPQPLRYWQCLASITNMYAQTMIGMLPFVAPIIHMTHRGHRSRRTAATPNAQFAIEVWRVVVIRAMANPDACAMPIAIYLQNAIRLAPLHSDFGRQPIALMRGDIRSAQRKPSALEHIPPPICGRCQSAVPRT